MYTVGRYDMMEHVDREFVRDGRRSREDGQHWKEFHLSRYVGMLLVNNITVKKIDFHPSSHTLL